MTNMEKYIKVFTDTLDITEEQTKGLQYTAIPAWDSVGHMALIAGLEDTFDIMMDTDDIIDFNSFEKGIELLGSNYDVEF